MKTCNLKTGQFATEPPAGLSDLETARILWNVGKHANGAFGHLWIEMNKQYADIS